MARDKTADTKTDELRVTADYTIRRPTPEEAIPIPVSEWRRLMNRIKETGERTSTYENQGWACLGLAGGCAIAALTTYISVKFVEGQSVNVVGIAVEIFLILSTLASGVIALTSFRFARQHASDHAKLRQTICDDMLHIEERHPPMPIKAAASAEASPAGK